MSAFGSIEVCPAATTAAIDSIAVPLGRHVLLDGVTEPTEWDDATVIKLSRYDVLYVKRDEAYLYIAVRPSTDQIYGIDLYVDRGTREVLNLHASAKLGERESNGGAWPEWNWWNNRGWAANVARGDDFQNRQFRRDEAKEFQIRLTKLEGAVISISVDIQSRAGTQSLPESGTLRDGKRWLPLRLR